MKTSSITIILGLVWGVFGTEVSGQMVRYPAAGTYPQMDASPYSPPVYGAPIGGSGGIPNVNQIPAGVVGMPPSVGGSAGRICGEACGGDCGAAWAYFGEFLYLRARGVEVPYAVPIDGPVVAPPSFPVQGGPVATADPDYQAGFRAGAVRTLDEQASLRGTYTFYESQTTDTVAISSSSSYVLRSLVTHPGTWTAASDGLDAQATYDIDFQIADVDYRCVFCCGPQHALAYFGGVKYVHLEQEFAAQYAVLGTELVNSRINFDGGGFRLGLEGERRGRALGLLVYGRAAANFVAGEFHADYLQRDASRGVVVNTQLTESRLITILDLELGVGWTTSDDRFRVTVGYMVSGWLNTVQTDEWIQGVQNNQFGNLSDTLTFDGFTTRVEMRF